MGCQTGNGTGVVGWEKIAKDVLSMLMHVDFTLKEVEKH